MRSSRCSDAVVVRRIGTREGDVTQVQRLTSRSVPLRLVVNSCHIRIPCGLDCLWQKSIRFRSFRTRFANYRPKVLTDGRGGQVDSRDPAKDHMATRARNESISRGVNSVTLSANSVRLFDRFSDFQWRRRALALRLKYELFAFP